MTAAEVIEQRQAVSFRLWPGLARGGSAGNARCSWCARSVGAENHGPFRDDESWREWRISGMCQSCQDAVFGVAG